MPTVCGSSILNHLLVSLSTNYLPIVKISAMHLSQAQTWNTGLVTKINIPVCQHWHSTSPSASQAYNELIFSVCDDLSADKRNCTQAALERRVFSKSNSKYLRGLLWQWTGRLSEWLCLLDDLIDSVCHITLTWSDWCYMPLPLWWINS